MNVGKIKDVIIDIIQEPKESSCKSILIDGVWGCGKTTAVKSAIEELLSEKIAHKGKIVYQSLFGVKDIAELTACYSYAGRNVYRVSKSVVGPFTKLIPFVGEQISESINNTTALFEPSPSTKKDVVFIFDDLERADYSLSYITLFGFFNQLIMRGCRIICISSLGDLSKLDRKNKKDLDAFLEKAFDRIIFINEYPDEIITQLFSDNVRTKDCVGQCLSMFDGNIRIAIKVHRLLQQLFIKEKELGLLLNKNVKDVQILKAAILSIKAIFSFEMIEDEKIKKQDNLDYLGILSKKQSNELNDDTRQNIKMIMDKNTFDYLAEERTLISHLAQCLCYMEAHDDCEELIKEYSPDAKKKLDEKYSDSIFYLDDEGKQLFLTNFKKDTKENRVPVNRQYIDKVAEIIKYTSLDINNDDFLDLVKSRIVDNYLKGDDDSFERLHDYVKFPNESDDKGLIEKLYNDVCSDISVKEEEIIKNEIADSLNNNDYRYLVDLIYDLDHHNKPEYVSKLVVDLLTTNSFYMPDISKQ